MISRRDFLISRQKTLTFSRCTTAVATAVVLRGFHGNRKRWAYMWNIDIEKVEVSISKYIDIGIDIA